MGGWGLGRGRLREWSRFVCLCGMASLALLLPRGAGAVTLTVDSTGDQPDAALGAGGCETAAATCTLRAAIEESNFSTTVDDAVRFKSALFTAAPTSTIAPAAPLPVITDTVSIIHFPCGLVGMVIQPCVGLQGTGFVVDADGVTITSFAITGANVGIEVKAGSDDFTATTDWFGTKLDGSPGPDGTGVLLGPNADGATIGAIVTPGRNLFANITDDALDLFGASDATVQGNYFGVTPDALTAAPNGKDIEVTDALAGSVAAEGNEIGGALQVGSVFTKECDGACNLISGSLSSGIDLNGDGGAEAPASGPTRIRANYVGLDGMRGAAIPNATNGIRVGGADQVSIGSGATEHLNYLSGGERAVLAGPGADGLELNYNLIGQDSGGQTLSPPSAEAISVDSTGLPEEAAPRIVANYIRMLGGTAISLSGTGGTIVENVVEGGATGIRTSVGPGGNAIAENVVEGTSGDGILVQNDANTITGNEVTDAGGAGIEIQSALGQAPTGNVIGGDLAAEENRISGSAGAAIAIVDLEATQNEVARNRGAGNGGPFVDLLAANPGTEPNGPNDGIQPPAISSTTEAGVSGNAQPGATVRIFGKATAAPGEIASFLGQVVAGPAGAWSFAYPQPQGPGAWLAVSQTGVAGGTSELAFATVPAPVSAAQSTAPPPPAGAAGLADRTPPNTRIGKRPAARTHARRATFRFSASEPGSRFQCSLDRKPFRACRSPRTFKRLRPGKHSFRVRAVDAAGNRDPTPAAFRFRVVRAKR
ncbi:MAG TPA: right-handed parallel beta-helix repeat-containing protein [Solirubrobacterales bacterium]|nr:right-handed parallel beta-helix repeat-containing protein [Solirubrobacterales bacterium]